MPQSVQFLFAYGLIVVAIVPVMWVRLRPGMSLRARQATILAGLMLRIVGFLVSYLIILRLAGDEIAPMLAEAGEWPFIAWGRQVLIEGGLPLAASVAVAVGLGAGRGVLLWRRTRRRAELLGFMVWNYTRTLTTPLTEYHRPPESALTARLPRSVAELITRGVVGSVVVGVTEELLFRVGIPALLVKTSGSVAPSVIFSLAVFALLHADQGWEGIVNAAVLGMAFTFVFFATGSIVLPIVLHALNNMYVLAALPVVGWRASRRQFDERLQMERLRAGAPGSISG